MRTPRRTATGAAAWVLALAAGIAGAGALATAGAAECGDAPAARSTLRLQGDGTLLLIRSAPSPIEVGRHFSLEIVVCDTDGGPAATVEHVDAHMPAHGHGMNYRARLLELAPGRYRAEGLMLHMPGRWELVVVTRTGEARKRLTQAIDLE